MPDLNLLLNCHPIICISHGLSGSVRLSFVLSPTSTKVERWFHQVCCGVCSRLQADQIRLNTLSCITTTLQVTNTANGEAAWTVEACFRNSNNRGSYRQSRGDDWEDCCCRGCWDCFILLILCLPDTNPQHNTEAIPRLHIGV